MTRPKQALTGAQKNYGKLTAYQQDVVSAWVADWRALGLERADALAGAQSRLPDELAASVKRVFDRRWPE